ncbi:hypothetical protein [Roseateles sp. P5_D6]
MTTSLAFAGMPPISNPSVKLKHHHPCFTLGISGSSLAHRQGAD